MKRKKLNRSGGNWHREAELFQGEAEQLPFRDGVFDFVFHFQKALSRLDR